MDKGQDYFFQKKEKVDIKKKIDIRKSSEVQAATFSVLTAEAKRPHSDGGQLCLTHLHDSNLWFAGGRVQK